MLAMRTAGNPANPVGELVSAQEALVLDHFALALDPFGLYGVQLRPLLRQKATYDPPSVSALLDVAVVLAEPAPYLAAYVPACVVPDEERDLLLAESIELLGAPSEKPSRYPTHGPTIH